MEQTKWAVFWKEKIIEGTLADSPDAAKRALIAGSRLSWPLLKKEGYRLAKLTITTED